MGRSFTESVEKEQKNLGEGATCYKREGCQRGMHIYLHFLFYFVRIFKCPKTNSILNQSEIEKTRILCVYIQ